MSDAQPGATYPVAVPGGVCVSAVGALPFAALPAADQPPVPVEAVPTMSTGALVGLDGGEAFGGFGALTAGTGEDSPACLAGVAVLGALGCLCAAADGSADSAARLTSALP